MQNLREKRKSLLAFTFTEIMVVSAIVTAIPTAQYAKAKQKALQVKCQSNLQQIGQAIVMFQMGEGKYPDAVFFPEKPFDNPKSIVKILEDAGSGIPREMWLCPAAPKGLRNKGLTFVYNDRFAGRRSLKNPSKAWLLIEVNCVSKKVPAPHPQGYNILFADGHVLTTKMLPPSITNQQRASIDKLRREMEGGLLANLFYSNGENTGGNKCDRQQRDLSPKFHITAPGSLRPIRSQRIRHSTFRKCALPLNTSGTSAARS